MRLRMVTRRIGVLRTQNHVIWSTVKHFAILTVSSVLFLGGCSNSKGAGATACIAGSTRECVGPGACRGGQMCRDDGSGWSGCDCGNLPDAGSAEGGNSPGMGGSTSRSSTATGGANSSSAGGTGGSTGYSNTATGGATGGQPTSSTTAGTCFTGEDTQVDLDQNGVADCSETLLENSQFVSSNNYWLSSDSTISSRWVAQDARGLGTSGALEVTDAVLGVDVLAIAYGPTQCVPVIAGAKYLIAGQFLVPSGQQNANANVYVFVYSDTACQNFITGGGPLVSQGVYDLWLTFSGHLAAVAGSQSMIIRLGATKNLPDPATKALYDNILLRLEN